MKFQVSDMLTIADIKSEDYNLACEFAKALTEKNFEDNTCVPGKLLKIKSVEIVRNRGQVVPWITVFTYEYSVIREISFNAYDSNDNYTINYKIEK